ncbi:hypothetical protein [Saccharopolyspora griseoalba]|uniref:Uncharacterized protein n=1 Tax=Saccharopolyspora griseoalba TaxID=1431848 RepID=A0ABW2LJP6_9PSEU
MGADLILAMALAALITRAWEQAKSRSKDAWRETRHRAAESWQRKADRVRSAGSKGPRDPLWWPYAAGWTLAAVGAGAVAGVHGLVAGAVTGARAGYVLGREGARSGWGYRGTWRRWRSGAVENCQSCGVRVAFELVVVVPVLGRVCPDCEIKEQASRPRRCAWCGAEFPQYLLDTDGWCEICSHGGQCDGNCKNSDMSPDDAEAQGLCGDCAGRGEFISNFGGRHRHTRCRECRGTGSSSRKKTSQQGPRSSESNDDTRSQRIYVHAERTDVNKEPTKEIGGKTVGELVSANGAVPASTGDGYTDTITSLSTMALLLGKAYEEAQSLGEHLTANQLDAATIGQISELTDLLETAAPLAANLHRHVENRHAPVADAVASAGGSGNVAERSWYDDY